MKFYGQYHATTMYHGIGRGAKFVKVIIDMDSYLFELTVGTLNQR